MAQATMNVRVDENIKKSFDEFCASAGLNASVAVNMFIRAVLRSRSIPFAITDVAESQSKAALALQTILRERIREGEETADWIAHDDLMRSARELVSI